jgi:MarR family transcriptional regulator, organic hydroperoxide resistance regulator
MMSTINEINYTTHVARANPHACDAWQLLVQLFFAHRANLPPLAAEFQLSPAQCHVLHLIEPGRPIPMGQLAETLACDASNVTGLVDRLEARGLVRRRPSVSDRRVKVLDLTPTGSRLRAILLERMTTPPATLERLSRSEQRALVRILTRLAE